MTVAPYIIMGAHGGIGAALSQSLTEMKLPVIATVQSRLTAEVFSSNNPDIEVKILDVTDSDAVTRMIESADKGAGIAGLAYCIGSIDLKPLKATQDTEFLKTYDLNVLGAVRALRAAEASLKMAGGSVVLFSTIAVQQGFQNHSLISTAKGAIEGLTRSLAAEWAPQIRVNCIAPSLTDTPLAKPFTGNEAMAKSLAALHPISRLGHPKDCAALAAFLLSDKAGWITGQVIHVDGGRSHVRVKG